MGGKLKSAICRKLVTRFEDDKLWDGIRAHDVPAEIVDFVIAEAKKGTSFVDIRKKLGITHHLSASWRKISAAIRGGTRVEGSVLYHRFSARAEKAVLRLDKTADYYAKKPKEFGKELAMITDAINRTQAGMIRMGKELGIFVDHSEKNREGVTVIVNTNVPMPSPKDILVHQEKQKALDVKDPESQT